MKKLTALIIMDGYGIATDGEGNCIGRDLSPEVKALKENYSFTSLEASGLAVGLPEGQMGNSEVGHLNIGAGRIVYQELTRISKEIEDGSFFENPALLKAVRTAREKGTDLHLMGLLSDGGVHSHNTHLYALLRLCVKEKMDRVFIHCFMDGRDVSPTAGKGFIEQLEKVIAETGVGKIASVCGRYYAMDRDNRWDRICKAYDMLTLGEGVKASDPVQAVEESYQKGVTDEFILPTVITSDGRPAGVVKDGDSVIFFNFRPDRARQMTRAFTQKDFSGFRKEVSPSELTWVCFTLYDASFTGVEIAFSAVKLMDTLGEYLAASGKKQFRIAETEKYAHVTFFFNGGVEAPNVNEDRFLIPSPKVATYDLQPEMSAFAVKDKAVELIKSGEYDVMILNFANCDMVGHTGNIPATRVAVQTVDKCVKEVVDAVLACGGRAFVTADHGNAEKMLDEKGDPFTAHTTNPVPFIYVSHEKQPLREGGKLCDIAPTMLDVMGLAKPAAMTGESLIKK